MFIYLYSIGGYLDKYICVRVVLHRCWFTLFWHFNRFKSMGKMQKYS